MLRVVGEVHVCDVRGRSMTSLVLRFSEERGRREPHVRETGAWA